MTYHLNVDVIPMLISHAAPHHQITLSLADQAWHNLDVIKTADYIIDLGPEGGDGGGTILATGTPEEIAEQKESYTGRYLKPILERDRARMEEKLETAKSK